jgi:hypothetical protein
MPRWVLPAILILLAFTLLVLLQDWEFNLLPVGADFSIQADDAAGHPAAEFYDSYTQHNFQFTTGRPLVLEGKVSSGSPVQITFPGSDVNPMTAAPQAGSFRAEYPTLDAGTYHIVARTRWISRDDLWLVYRPDFTPEILNRLFTRSLAVTLDPSGADLVYKLASRPEFTRAELEADPEIINLLGNRIPASLIVAWAFYFTADQPNICPGDRLCFTGGETEGLEASDVTIEGNSLNLEFTARVSGDGSASKLNRLLQVSAEPSNPISIELHSDSVALTDVQPLPDAKGNASWYWRQGPVHIGVTLTPSAELRQNPGAVGLGEIRRIFDSVGLLVAGLMLEVIPLIPIIWWLVLARRGVVDRSKGWPVWFAGLLWLAPLVLLILFFLIKIDSEPGILVLAGAALALALLALVFQPGWLQKKARSVLILLALTLAIPILTLVSRLSLASSWSVVGLVTVFILALLRLLSQAFNPQLKIPRYVWLLPLLITPLLAFPAELPAFGYVQGEGWFSFLWIQYLFLGGIYILPFIVMLAALGELRDRQAQFTSQPGRLVRIGKLLFVAFLIGTTRGFNPGLQELPSIFPIAFGMAFLVYPRLFTGDETELSSVGSLKEQIHTKQADLIQKALDLEWAKRALNKLIQSDSPDPKGYEDQKTQLIAYIETHKPDVDADHISKNAENVFNFGPYASPWKNGVLGAKHALFISFWLLLVYLPVIVSRASSQLLPFVVLVTLLIDIVPLLVKWVLLGFFLGYFFPYLRGSNGWQKGLTLALGVAACTVPHDLLNGSGLDLIPAIALDVAQTALILTILGLWTFDYEVLRQNGHNLKRLLIVHNLTFLAGYGTSVVAVIGSVITGFVTYQIDPVINSLLNLITPGGKPPV